MRKMADKNNKLFEQLSERLGKPLTESKLLLALKKVKMDVDDAADHDSRWKNLKTAVDKNSHSGALKAARVLKDDIEDAAGTDFEWEQVANEI